MSENVSPQHLEWLKQERPQTFRALFFSTSADHEDLKSCCVRLEAENAVLKAEVEAAREVRAALVRDYTCLEDAYEKMEADWNAECAENDELRAEVERLKAEFPREAT